MNEVKYISRTFMVAAYANTSIENLLAVSWMQVDADYDIHMLLIQHATIAP